MTQKGFIVIFKVYALMSRSVIFDRGGSLPGLDKRVFTRTSSRRLKKKLRKMDQDGKLTHSEKNAVPVPFLEQVLTDGRKLSFSDVCDELVSQLTQHWIHSEKNEGPVP